MMNIKSTGSVHNKGKPTGIDIAQHLPFSKIFQFETLVYIHCIANQNSVGYLVHMPYFTNMKVFVYIPDFTDLYISN